VGDIRVAFEPGNRRGLVPAGSSVLEAANTLGVPLTAPCGGNGVCGKCLCAVRSGRFREVAEQRERVGDAPYAAGLRLACQTTLESDAVVEVSESTTGAEQHILEEAASQIADGALDTPLRKVVVTMPKPSLHDQRADLERLLDALGEQRVTLCHTCPAALLAGLPHILRAQGFTVTCTLNGQELLAVEPGDTSGELYGAAFDIGTTTVVGYLVDLLSGRRVATASCVNPQIAYGDDVVSRISHIQTHADGLETLSSLIRSALNDLLAELAAEAGTTVQRVYRLTVVGNATMNHILWGTDPSNIARAPYTPVVHRGMMGRARDVSLALPIRTPVYTLPNIAGWIGADTAGVVLSTRIHQAEEPWLAIDIGTNGEIVVGSAKRLIACSAAAGPAFEGAQIRYGMRATGGAVDHVDFDGGRVSYTTIGNAPARGICGSGLFDIMAVLLDSGCVNEAGMLLRSDDPGAEDLPADLKRRLTTVDGTPAFVLAADEETSIEGPVVLTQRDIRQIQLAKGAIAAGIRIALGELGLNPGDIARVVLAGAFGSYVRPASAARIGVFPPELVDRAEGVGNAAGAGARLALVSETQRVEAERIVGTIEYLELASRLDFNEVFADEMMFPAMHDLAGPTRPHCQAEERML